MHTKIPTLCEGHENFGQMFFVWMDGNRFFFNFYFFNAFDGFKKVWKKKILSKIVCLGIY